MNKDNRDRRKEMMNERVDDVCDRDNNVYNREKVYVYIVYISEIGVLRSDAPRHRGVDGGTPAHSNQYNTRSYDKYNCATMIVVRSIVVAFCCNVHLNYFVMQTKVLSIKRIVDAESSEVLNQFVVYTDNKEIPSLRMRKDWLTEVKTNSFKVYDSYLESCLYDAISSLKEGRIYSQLLDLAIDTDSIVSLLLANATIDVTFEKVDSLNESNSLGYYYKYDISNIQLSIDEYSKVTMFEMYRKIFADKSEAYLKFIAQMLGVDGIFFA